MAFNVPQFFKALSRGRDIDVIEAVHEIYGIAQLEV